MGHSIEDKQYFIRTGVRINPGGDLLSSDLLAHLWGPVPAQGFLINALGN